MSGPPPLSATWQRADELRALGDFAAARDLLEPAADVAAIRLGPDDRAVVETQRRLATVHRELGELASARRVLEEALDGGLLGLGDADPLILGISAELGAIADELGNKHEARRNLARVARYGPAVLGADHPYVRTAQRYLGVDAPLPAPPVPAWEPVEPGVYRSADPATPAPATPAATAPAATAPAATTPASPNHAPQDHAIQEHAPPEPAAPAPPDPGWQASTAIVPLVPHQPPAEQAVPQPLPVPGQPAAWSGARGTWAEPAARPAQPAARPGRRGWWIVLTAVLAAVVAAGAALAVLALTSRPAPPGAGAASPSAPPSAPRDVQLRDDGVSVTLTWTDPSSGTVPFLIAEGRVGEQLRALQPLPAGQTAYTLNGLNPTLDYCFAVVATYDTNVVATSDPVCTDRRHEPGPSASGGPGPSAGPSR